MAVLSTLKHHGSYDRTCLIYDNLCLYITVMYLAMLSPGFWYLNKNSCLSSNAPGWPSFSSPGLNIDRCIKGEKVCHVKFI